MTTTTTEQSILANEILPSIGSNADRLPNKKITGFLAMTGDCYDQQLMVVGRAVNGWISGIFPRKLNSLGASGDFAAIVCESISQNDGCPMAWVSDQWGNSASEYNTKRSAFWRVIRSIVAELGISDVDHDSWPSFLVWSNLYKVAPACGGNPGVRLCESQLSGCISLFEAEISKHRPRHLLLLTGLDWAEPFMKHIFPGFITVSNSYVEAIGQTKLHPDTSTTAVVAVHPQCKKEDKWSNEVLKAFRSAI